MNKISVIIPIYNVENYIKQCYESIKNQTYKNWEVFFIVDGATDGSYEVCKEISQKDNRVQVIKTDNYGVSHARNIGIDMAKGEFVTFIDPDDYIESNCFESFIKRICETNADMIFARYYYKDKNKINSTLIKFSEMDSKDALKYHLRFKFMSSICFGIYKFDCIKNIRLVENIKCYEDWEFLFQMIQNSSKIAFCEDGFYHYVTRQGSASKTEFNNNHMTALYIEDEVKTKIKNPYQYNNELECLKLQIMLRIIIIYSASNSKNNEYKNIFKKIARKEFYKVLKYKELDLKQKIYISFIAINPDIYKKLYRLKNGGKNEKS